ncbi:DUF3310 domain-containing protein [Roseomonas sp. WA12]
MASERTDVSTSPRPFVEGDTVRAIRTDFPLNFPVGTIGTVRTVRGSGCGVTKPGDDEEWNFWNGELELVEPALTLPPEPHNLPITQHDPISSPTHYARWALQPIEFIRRNNLPFLVGNVIKYVLRYDAKNGVEDLRKAKQYLEWLIEDVAAKEAAK